MLDDGSVPPYIALYESLITLQKEIEQSLPEFQEMVLGLQKQDAAAALGTIDTTPEDILSPSRSESSPSSLAAMKAKNKNNLALQRDAAQARKQLLANFANYDSTAKRIRNLDDQGNTSLARVKLAIWAKANLFLQQNMFPLQSLPKMSSGKEKKKSSSGANTPTSSGNLSDAAEPVRPFKSLLEGKDAKADARAAQLVQSDPQAAKESLVVLEQQLKLVLEYAVS
jgi:rabenosyn-5